MSKTRAIEKRTADEGCEIEIEGVEARDWTARMLFRYSKKIKAGTQATYEGMWQRRSEDERVRKSGEGDA